MWVAVCRLVGFHTDSGILVSSLNAFFGALALCVFYSLVRRRLGSDPLTALLVTSLPAFSWGFWYYSACVEVYIIPLFLQLMCLYLLTEEHVDGLTFALVGFLNALAVLVAEMSVLFSLVVLVAAWLRYRRDLTNLAKSLAKYLLAAVPTAAIPYVWAVMAVGEAGSFRSAWAWLTDYAHYPRFWTPLSVASIPKAGIGLARSFVGSNFVLVIPSFRHWVERLLEGFYLADEAFLVRNMGTGTAYLLVALVVILFLIVFGFLASSLREWRTLSARKRELVYLATTWCFSTAAFVFFYTSVNAKLWIQPTLCFWLIFLTFVLTPSSRKKPRLWLSRGVLAITAAILFSLNFQGSIRFTQSEANDYYYAQIEPLVKLTNPGDLIVIGTAWKFEPYLRRYGKARVLCLSTVYKESGTSSLSVERVRSAIEKELAAGRRVVISGEALEPQRETMRAYPGMTIFRNLWDEYRGRWSQLVFAANVAYVLQDTGEGTNFESRNEWKHKSRPARTTRDLGDPSTKL